MTFFDRLRAAASAEWQAFTEHEFVRRIADGTLSEAAFRFYLVQDYRFLVHFARAHALLAYKADDVADLRSASHSITAIVDVELDLHVAYCTGWGVSATDLEHAAEHAATVAYTRYVLDVGHAGDALDLAVALTSCTIGYGEIGARLARDAATVRDGNPYLAWIDTYAGDGYQAVVGDARARLERLAAARASDGRFAALVSVFRRAAELEAAFWQMGIDAGARPGAASGPVASTGL
jgi:thiaminase/transcriptional activator TenA